MANKDLWIYHTKIPTPYNRSVFENRIACVIAYHKGIRAWSLNSQHCDDRFANCFCFQITAYGCKRGGCVLMRCFHFLALVTRRRAAFSYATILKIFWKQGGTQYLRISLPSICEIKHKAKNKQTIYYNLVKYIT